MASFTLRLPDDLSAAIDALAGDVPRNRWIQRVLEREVARADREAVIDRTRGLVRTEPPLPLTADEKASAVTRQIWAAAADAHRRAMALTLPRHLDP